MASLCLSTLYAGSTPGMNVWLWFRLFIYEGVAIGRGVGDAIDWLNENEINWFLNFELVEKDGIKFMVTIPDDAEMALFLFNFGEYQKKLEPSNYSR